MFTGLVDDVGTIDRVASTDAGREFRVRCRYDDLRDGESIAVDGVCLTVRERGPGSFTAAAVWTTLAVTTLGSWAAGKRVNLERAMRPTDRLGGHFVQGHVDGVARVTRAAMEQDAFVFDLALPAGLSELMVDRGSLAVNGVSLTVVGLPAPDVVQLSIIDHTRVHTTLGELKEGDLVHVEADILAKHVRRLLEGRLKFEGLRV
jgi:riboflavin synthase